MKKTLIATLVAASALTVAGVASAANTSGFAGAGNGFYVGGNLGYGYADWSKTALSEAPITANKINDKGGFAWGAEAGYMFNSNIGLELSYDAFSNAKIMQNTTQIGKIKDQDAIGMSTVLNLPINNTFSTFAKLGGAYLTPKFVENGTTDYLQGRLWAPVVALGASFALTQNLSLNAQVKDIIQTKAVKTNSSNVTSTPQTTPNYYMATAGVTYKF